ncbi:MAG: hypothetical protein ACP5PJ_10660, partial [Acidimicrobiales bacterium]
MTASDITLTGYATRWGKIFSPGELTALNFALSEYGEDSTTFFELLASICQSDTLIVDTCPEIGLLARASNDWVIRPYRYVVCPFKKLNDSALRANEAPLDANRYVRVDSVEDLRSELGRFDSDSNSVIAILDDITNFERLFDCLRVDRPDFTSTFILKLDQPQWLDAIQHLSLGGTHSMFGFAAPRFNPSNWRGQDKNAFGDAHDVYLILTTNRELVESTKSFHPLPTSRQELVETSFENGGISVQLTTSANIADFLDTVPRYSTPALARVRTIGLTHLRPLKYYFDRTGVPDIIPREVQDIPHLSKAEHPSNRRNNTRILVRSRSLLRPRHFLRLGRTKDQYERGPHARNSTRQRIQQILAAPLHFIIGIPAADWSAEFDDVFYRATVNGLTSSGLSPINHFIIYGFAERRLPNARALFLSAGGDAPEQIAESLVAFNKAVRK